MNLDHHKDILNELCRLCGGRARHKTKLPRPCKDYLEQIKVTFAIDCSIEDRDIFPQNLCHTCYCKLYKEKTQEAVSWRSHPRTGDCDVCKIFDDQKKGGRPKRYRAAGRKRKDEDPIEVIKQLETGPSSSIHHSEKFIANKESIYNCSICQKLSNHGLESPCGHIFCQACVVKAFQDASSNTIKCKCSSNIHYTGIKSPQVYFETGFYRELTTCRICKVSVSMDEQGHHSCSSKIEEILARPLDAPITKSMEQLGTHIMKTKMKQSQDGLSFTYKTGGQPLTAVYIPQPRVSSASASKSTVKNRTKILATTREILSKGNTQQQMADEIKCYKDDQLENSLSSLHQQKVLIPAGEFLGLKADLCASWKKNRELKSWLRRYGVITESEHKMRAEQNVIIGDNLISEWLPFVFQDEVNGTVVRKTPCISVKSLKQKVTQQLVGYERLGLLTSHGIIKDEEVWLKIGGDKGGGTFKMMFQIGNTTSPNAPRNTVLVCMFPASDTMFNLKLGLARLKDQVQELQMSCWKNKTFRVFGFGDYEYLCRMYGLAGASGKHCCLWCEISKQEIQLAPDKITKTPPPRSLATLARDLEAYKADGSRPGRMKLFKNVIDEPLFNIPLEQVCIPGLHISLGLFLKHFKSLENKCHQLDTKIAMIANQPDGGDGASEGFTEACKKWKTCRDLQEQAEELGDAASFLKEHLAGLGGNDESMAIYAATIADHLQEKEKLLQEATSIKKNIRFTMEQGPIVQVLDKALQDFNVQRQAYHGKSFVGNHVHRCCKKENIEHLLSSVVGKTEHLCPQLFDEAKKIADRYRILLRLFASCHNVYNVASTFTDADIKALGQKPNWRNISESVSFALFHNCCEISLKNFCWVKYEVDGKEVIGKILTVYAMGDDCEGNNCATVDVGYYPDIKGQDKIYQENKKEHTVTQSFMFLKEPPGDLDIKLTEIEPDIWKPKLIHSVINYGKIELSVETRRSFSLKRPDSTKSPLSLCCFIVSKGDDFIDLHLNLMKTKTPPNAAPIPSHGSMNETVTVKVLVKLSQELGDSWKFIGRLLELEDPVLDHISTNNVGNQQEMSYKMLCKWKEKNGDNATYKVLGNAFTEYKRGDLVEKLKKLQGAS